MRDGGHVQRYQHLSVDYVDHHNPDLIIFDVSKEEVQRIDLTRIKTLDNMHKLMKLLGMKGSGHDGNTECASWQAMGQCTANPAFMLQQCRLSCGVCTETAESDASTSCVNASPDSDCEYWSTVGECTKNPTFMNKACARSCGICKPPAIHDDDDDDDFKDEL